MTFVLEAFVWAYISIVFVEVLTEPGMIFGWYARLIDRIPQEWIRKPLGECLYCFAGQFSLWGGIFYHLEDLHLLAVIKTMFLTIFITLIYTLWKLKN